MLLSPHGIARQVVLRLRRAFSQVVDRRVGVVTVDESVASKMGMDDASFRRRLRAFGWTSCWRVLRRLPTGRGEVFLDIGCGVGRMICAASLRGYDRVIGVEIAEELAATAVMNIAAMRPAHAPCEVVIADATQYVVPDDVTVVFLYNTVQAEAFDATMRQLVATFDRRPRRLTIAYANAVEGERLAGWPRFRETGRLQLGLRPGAEWRRTLGVRFYQIAPPA